MLDVPATTEEYLILEELDPALNKDNINNILNSFDVNRCFLNLVVLSFFLIFVIVNVLKFKIYLNFKLKKSNLIRLPKDFAKAKCSFAYTLSALGIFLLFYDFHLFFVQLIMTNTVKTNKVVVDVSNIIKDEHDIFSTKKVIVFV